MQVNSVSSRLVSALGNPSSKLPLAVKDVVNSLGVTYYSYDAGGELEGKDRLIDEFGTQAIWLWGIPVFKKLIDKTAYKAANLNPDVDIRIITNKNKNYLELAKEYAPDIVSKKRNFSILPFRKGNEVTQIKSMRKSIEDAANNSSTFKKLFYTKFVAATALTMGAYFGLTKIKQAITKKQIKKDFIKKINNDNNKFLAEKTNQNPIFKGINNNPNSQNNPNKPSFGSAAKLLEGFMFDPVKNMFIVDASITGERLKEARNPQEFKEYAIKEGSFLFFMYVAGKQIQNGIESIAKKVFKTPVKLDAKFLMSDELKNSMKNGTIENQLKKFNNLSDETEIYKFLFKNQNSVLVKASQAAGIIDAVKVNDKEVINTAKFIDLNKVKQVATQLEDFVKSYASESTKSGITIEKFLSKAKTLKVLSTIANIGVCCLALGVAIPKLIYKFRADNQNGNKDFHVKKEYEKELMKSFGANQINQKSIN